MKYTVNISETHYGFVEVEADTKSDALDRARELADAGEVHWINSEQDFNIDSKTKKRRGGSK